MKKGILQGALHTAAASLEPKAQAHTCPGRVHIVTPGGKIEITAILSSSDDVRHVKKVLNVLLDKCGEDADFDHFLGLTD